MSLIPLRWTPDPESATILAAYRRTREPIGSILRRALKLLAQADGLLNTSSHIRNSTRPGTRPTPGPRP